MASNINFQNINAEYPIAGKDQSSQGFRDNFGVIKSSLNVAKTEIESLQSAISNLPTVTDVGDLVNDAGFITITDVSDYLETEEYLTQTEIVELLTENNYTTVSDVNSILTSGQYVTESSLADSIRDAGYITIDEIDDIFPELGEVSKTKLDSISTTATASTTTAKINTLTLTNSSLIDNFIEGQIVRIFGAGTDQIALSAPLLTGVTKNGVIDGSSLVEYKICQFEYSTGKISAPSLVLSQSVDLAAFNTVNNIALTFSRTSPNNGLLIYRKIDSSLFELIAVLGTKDLDLSLVGTYVDYMLFDFTEWSRKSTARNSYISSTGTIHFPIVAPTVASLGWIDTTIQSVNTENFRITLATTYFFNSQVTIVHNDTDTIQTAISDFVEKNQNVLRLGSKTYFVSSLEIPNNFSIIGDSNKTLIKKLPWSSNTLSTNKIFKSLSTTATSVSIENITIDGDMQNQYLLNDSVDDSVNYTVDIRGNDITFSNLVIKNVIGGGISSRESTDLTINESRIYDSGMSDRYAASPVLADLGTGVIISSNVMRNFSDSVDMSLTNIGSIVGNIVNNCGSGISIFGSTKLISSPNLILGPAGEFIPGPDILNSEFNAVNIVIEPGVTFISDVYVYQENGQLFDLTANGASITYKVNQFRKIDNVEEIGDEVLINDSTPISAFTGTNLANGEFKFAITSDKTTILKTTYSYSTLKAIDQNHVGLIYRAFLTEFPVVATVDAAVEPNNIFSGGNTFYTVRLSTTNNLSIGFKVRLPGHGGTPSLSSAVGTINAIIASTNECVIVYPFEVTVTGSGGSLAVENSFVLAKGKIQ